MAKMTTKKELFEQELNKHGLSWCKGGCGVKSSHKRGFVLHKDKKTIHFDSEIATRGSLHNGLHEIGHCVNNEDGLRSFEREAKAEEFATNKMREWGISVPRKVVALGKDYVKRKKRHGDKVKRGRQNK